jgi:hypothetical protein
MTHPMIEFALTPTSLVLAQIADERDRQNAKWGEQNHPDGTDQLGATGHERARLVKRLVDESAKLGRLTWALILAEEVAEAECESDPVKLREELIQVAAVTVAWIEAIDRRRLAEDVGLSPVPVVLAVDPGVQVEQAASR